MTTKTIAKHTPGPWIKYRFPKDGNYTILSEKNLVSSGHEDEQGNVHNDNKKIIAENVSPCDTDLIRSAPELLSFIKFLVYDGHLPSTCENSNDTKNCLKCLAMDLIAKAEGAQNG